MSVDASGRVIDAEETAFDLTPIVHLRVCLSTSQLLWILDYTREQGRVTADVAGLEKRADKTDASIKELKSELLMRADKTEASIQDVVKEIKSEMKQLKTELVGAATEIKTDAKELKSELLMRADKTDSSIQE